MTNKVTWIEYFKKRQATGFGIGSASFEKGLSAYEYTAIEFAKARITVNSQTSPSTIMRLAFEDTEAFIVELSRRQG